MNNEIVRWIKIVVLRTLREKNLTRLDVSTLVSAGMFGYAQAKNRFDPSRNVKFKTFAEYRIKGAVLDEVRKMIGDERAKHKRPRKVDDYDFSMISDNSVSQRMIESSMDLERFALQIDLSAREMDILTARVQGKSLREISVEFDFSESRASQILAKIKQTVYTWYQDELGPKFKLITHVCPACKQESCISDKVVEFRCDTCDERLIVQDGSPILAGKELEIDEEEIEDHPAFRLAR